MSERSFIGLASNLGDRTANLAHAVQGLRRIGLIGRVSSIFETTPIGVEGPAFFNAVAELTSDLRGPALSDALRDIERRLGRAAGTDTKARPIDLDTIDQNSLLEQPYYLAPLLEIEPGFPGEAGNAALRARLAAIGETYRKREGMHMFRADVQSGAPAVALSIDRVGVSRIIRSLRVELDGRVQQLLGEFQLTADLAFDRAGVHMSRFSEHLESTTLDILADGEAIVRIGELPGRIARAIVPAQGAAAGEVNLSARFTLERWTPVSGRRGEENYLLLARSRATAAGTRTLLGVEVEGMTACPCAQKMMHEQGFRDLLAVGFTAADAERALAALPAATHNQRGRGRLLVGLPTGIEADIRLEDLTEIVEQSLSSETYELLKRPDEFFVVNKAHQNPRFVEDVVRGIIARALDFYKTLPDDAFFAVAQTNDESIHKHDAVAAAHGTLGEFRAELAGRRRSAPRTTIEEWLHATG